MEGRVTIIGLGCVGCSIGLALREKEPDLEIMGHDVDGGNARLAKRMGAVSKTHWNLPAAVEGAGLVILALPIQAVKDTLEVLGEHLADGATVTDTASLKTPVIEWAEESLPDRVHFISGVPVPGPMVEGGTDLVGPESARADLFDGGVYCITPSPRTHKEASSTLVELAEALGSSPLFIDPAEHDGLYAGVGDLASVISLALIRATLGTPGWAEMRKVAGVDFVAMTSTAAINPEDRLGTLLLNRENLLRRLDMFMEELRSLRGWLREPDRESLEESFAQAAEDRARWINERIEGTWEEMPGGTEITGPGEAISRMLVGNLFRRRPIIDDEEE